MVDQHEPMLLRRNFKKSHYLLRFSHFHSDWYYWLYQQSPVANTKIQNFSTKTCSSDVASSLVYFENPKEGTLKWSRTASISKFTWISVVEYSTVLSRYLSKSLPRGSFLLVKRSHHPTTGPAAASGSGSTNRRGRGPRAPAPGHHHRAYSSVAAGPGPPHPPRDVTPPVQNRPLPQPVQNRPTVRRHVGAAVPATGGPQVTRPRPRPAWLCVRGWGSGGALSRQTRTPPWEEDSSPPARPPTLSFHSSPLLSRGAWPSPAVGRRRRVGFWGGRTRAVGGARGRRGSCWFGGVLETLLLAVGWAGDGVGFLLQAVGRVSCACDFCSWNWGLHAGVVVWSGFVRFGEEGGGTIREWRFWGIVKWLWLFFSLAYLVCVSVGDSDSGSGKPVAQRFSFISAYYTEKLVYLGDDFGRNWF